MKKLLLIVMSLVLLLAACSAAQPGSSASPDKSSAANPGGVRAVLKQQPIQPVGEDFVNGVNAFGFKSASLLYSENENLALSPVSLELALSMTRTGAAGVTADEMAKALSLTGMSDEDIKSACRSLIWRANTGGMEAANSIWLGEGYPFSEAFLNGCTEDFMADAFPLVIPGAEDDINAWGSEKTHGKIDKIIPYELSEDTKLVLYNALYYLGKWETPFEANDTHDVEFSAPEGSVTVSFMNDERGMLYYSNDEFSMVSLPFKSEDSEGKYAMAFLLPSEGSDVASMLSSLDADSFSQAIAGLKDQQVRLMLPKFEYAFFTSFVDTLKALGMNAAFENADFSKMTDSPNELYIEEVLHKCYIKVDELGAEAAAVTVVAMTDGAAMPPDNIKEFIADRPFVFAIYSQEDGTIAFMGAVNDPSQK